MRSALNCFGNLLDVNLTGCAVAQSDPCAIDLTQDGLGAGDFGNNGGFTKTHFANSLAKLGVTSEFEHATHTTGR